MPLIERWTQYMFDAITKMQVENIKSVTPSLEKSKMFRQHADLFLQRTAWTSACASWFKQGRKDGQAVVYPGSRLHFMHLMEAVRWEDAARAAADGSRVLSLSDLPSGIDWGICVGELFFGVEPRKE